MSRRRAQVDIAELVLWMTDVALFVTVVAGAYAGVRGLHRMYQGWIKRAVEAQRKLDIQTAGQDMLKERVDMLVGKMNDVSNRIDRLTKIQLRLMLKLGMDTHETRLYRDEQKSEDEREGDERDEESRK